MRAILVDTDGVRLGETADPVTRPDQALVEVERFTVVARNLDHAARQPVGSVPGFDTVGTVVRAAEDGSGPGAGVRVAAAQTGNAWAALRAVPTSELAVVPDAVDPGLASALLVPGVSALRTLRRLGPIEGRRLLVTGASGAVGHFAVQLGKLAGATVVASVRDLGHAPALHTLGAHEVVTGAAKAFGVIDSVGGPLLSEAFDLLEDGGALVSVGASSGQPTTFAPYQLIGRNRRIEGFWAGDRFGPDLGELLALAAQGDLTPLDGERFGWEKIDAVVARLRSSDSPGRAIVSV